MRRFIFIIIYFIPIYCAAQEEEYYKKIEKRNKSFEVENLPNLDSKFSNFYWGVSGAFRRAGINRSSGFEEFGNQINDLADWEEFNLGLNLDNNFFIETGIMRNKNQFLTQVFSTLYNPEFLEGRQNIRFYIPLVFKKRLFLLDRIAKNAAINVGGGGGILIIQKPKTESSETQDLQTIFKTQYLSNFNVTSSQSSRPIYGELNMEIRGNVTDRLGLTVFFKEIFRGRKYFENTFEIRFTDGQTRNYSAFETGFCTVFGLRVDLSSKKFYRYSSKI